MNILFLDCAGFRLRLPVGSTGMRSVVPMALLCILMMCPFCSYAQSNIPITAPRITPLSPEAAGVAKYASYPVDYSTGVPQISIPLYEIVSRDITLPITLSYHASGLKPKEESGWVGSGWTLNAVPSVVRIINGLPDEERSNKTGVLSNPNLRSRDKVYLRDWIDNGLYDEQPDRYIYRLATKSGSFYPSYPYDYKDVYNSNNQKFMMHPHQTVQAPAGIVTGSIESFQMYDDNGLNYLFGDWLGQDCTEKSGQYITQWFCRAIESPKTGATVRFNYGNTQISPARNPFELSDYVVVEDAWPGFLFSQGFASMITKTGGMTNYHKVNSDGTLSSMSGDLNIYNYPDVYTADRVYKKKVQSIEFDNGMVEFAQSGDNLQSITVKDKKGNIVRLFQFFITKYNSETELTKLDSVRVFYGSTDMRTYRFEYDRPQYVHPMNTKAVDHFGYCNSIRPVSTSAVPKGRIEGVNDGKNTFDINVGNGNRNSHELYMKMGVLTDIYTPEGVWTRFTYEANRYGVLVEGDRKLRNHSTATGGLRVRMIEDRDMQRGQVVSRRYFNYGYYDNNRYPAMENRLYEGWGVPKHVPGIRDYGYTQYRISVDKNTGDQKRSRVRTYGSYPLTTLTYNDGSTVLYNCVSERMVVTGQPDRTTKYYYDVPYWDVYSDCHGIDYDAELSDDLYDFYNRQKRPLADEMPFDENRKDDHLYGLLTRTEKYSGENLISKTEYEYSSVNDAYTPFPSVVDNDVSIGIVSGKGYKRIMVVADRNDQTSKNLEEFLVNRPRFMPGLRTLSKMSTTDYFEGGKSVVKTEEYTYNKESKHLLPVKTKSATSTGGTIETFDLYPENVPAGSSQAASGRFFLSQNCLKTLLERKVVTSDKDTSVVQAVYDGFNLQTVREKARAGAPFRERMKVHAYQKGNIASASNDGLPPVSYLWSYGYQYPIAKIEYPAYSEVVAAMGGATAVTQIAEREPTEQDFARVEALRTALPNALITTYRYNPLYGVTEIKDPAGSVATFDYDEAGRLKLAKDALNRKTMECSYNLIGSAGGSGAPSESYYPLSANLDAYIQQTYSMNRPLTFTVTQSGGSGNFRYTWGVRYNRTSGDFLTGPEKDTYLSQATESKGQIILNFKKTGLYSLSCKIFDIYTGSEVEANAYFYVNP